jgi:uncharacterized protein
VASSWIETLNCNFVDPLDMKPEDLRIEEIAHALSHQCRFNGYTSRHYSVAEHSVYVARYVGSALAREAAPFRPGTGSWKRILRQALLHDATEAYLVDIPRPIKHALPQYKEIEERLWKVVAERFDVDEEMHPAVVEADMRICSTEKMSLLSSEGFDRPEWAELNQNYPPYVGEEDIIDRFPPDTQPKPSMIRRRFLDFYDQVKA